MICWNFLKITYSIIISSSKEDNIPLPPVITLLLVALPLSQLAQFRFLFGLISQSKLPSRSFLIFFFCLVMPKVSDPSCSTGTGKLLILSFLYLFYNSFSKFMMFLLLIIISHKMRILTIIKCWLSIKTVRPMYDNDDWILI